MKKFSILLPVLVAMALVGCGKPTCKSVCEDSKSCKGDRLQACIDECNNMKKEAKKTDCESEFDAMIDCAEGTDMCLDGGSDDNFSQCEKPVAKLLACAIAYCLAHPANCVDMFPSE